MVKLNQPDFYIFSIFLFFDERQAKVYHKKKILKGKMITLSNL